MFRGVTDEFARSRVVLAVLLVALGVLVVEIALTRLLSFTLWYHFTYVVLAVALLGYGASGAFLACSKRLESLPPRAIVHGSALLATAAGVLALLAICFLPFQPLEMATAWDAPSRFPPSGSSARPARSQPARLRWPPRPVSRPSRSSGPAPTSPSPAT
jgi:hypothetical protein